MYRSTHVSVWKYRENPNRNRKYMFERIFMKNMSVTYIQYVPTHLKKNKTVKENNLKTEENR